jgi:ribosomal protein L30/L7E
MTMLAGGPSTGCSFVNHEPQEKTVHRLRLGRLGYSLLVMDT